MGVDAVVHNVVMVSDTGVCAVVMVSNVNGLLSWLLMSLGCCRGF